MGLIRYLGPLRARPERRYIWGGAAPEDMGTSGENVIAALLASRAWGRVIDHRADGKGWKRTVEMQVASSLKDLNLVHDFSVEDLVVGKTAGTGIFEVRVRRAPNGPWTLLSDVGFGVSQVLPVLVLCYYVPAGSTVLLEQPELHLHPSAAPSTAHRRGGRLARGPGAVLLPWAGWGIPVGAPSGG